MDAGEQQAVLERARAGDARGLAELLESFRPYVRVLARSAWPGRVHGRLDESDLIQDALLEAHRSFPRFRGTTLAEFVAWLRQIVLHTSGRTLRGQTAPRRDIAREQPLDLSNDVADPGSTPSVRAMRHEQAARLAQALARLPQDMQQVLLYRHVDGLGHAEIGRHLGRSEGAVRVLYLRALQRLRAQYQQE